ncbi:hypothetical protein H5410_055827 [Solanum commersonii]|uniref:Uncharacterized protein n=1 Tax=Solanum commersonii TaxID=4109 RepID=A0A9J5WJV3_SOLCO|nr:hypothetical protein H5410_055827 [Solanum commersonii]
MIDLSSFTIAKGTQSWKQRGRMTIPSVLTAFSTVLNNPLLLSSSKFSFEKLVEDTMSTGYSCIDRRRVTRQNSLISLSSKPVCEQTFTISICKMTLTDNKFRQKHDHEATLTENEERPIRLKSSQAEPKQEHSKSYFNFENWWLNTEGFVFTGRLDYILACKHKALKGRLKKWSKNEQGNLKIQRGRIDQKPVVLMDYEELHIHEEIAWRQRSGTLWMKEGQKYQVLPSHYQCS